VFQLKARLGACIAFRLHYCIMGNFSASTSSAPATYTLPYLFRGISLQGVELATDLISMSTYSREACFRQENKSDWITPSHGAALIGYDVCNAIKSWVKKGGNDSYSVCELMYKAGYHEHVGQAELFVSHVQTQSLSDFLADLRSSFGLPWNGQFRRSPPFAPFGAHSKFWIDYFVLRQCQQDFRPHQVKEVIVQIGAVLAIKDHEMKYFTRAFCIMEIAMCEKDPYIVLSQSRSERILSLPASSDVGWAVDSSKATARDPNDLALIRSCIHENGGFSEFDQKCKIAMQANW